jgi:hypothetical protein
LVPGRPHNQAASEYSLPRPAHAPNGRADGETPSRTKVALSAKTNFMSYIEQFEAELGQKLNGNEDTTVIVRWVSEKILESYRNGITAGQKGAQVIRKGHGI